MIQKIKSKKGFTLAELLIVIAIIGVLIAIAIPVFGSQLKNAQDAVADSDKRAAQSMAVVVNMQRKTGMNAALYAVIDEKHNMTIVEGLPAAGPYYTVTFSSEAGKLGTVLDVVLTPKT
ncbi:MAG: type II secretion system protein [Oscillospiraceae bacterium]